MAGIPSGCAWKCWFRSQPNAGREGRKPLPKAKPALLLWFGGLARVSLATLKHERKRFCILRGALEAPPSDRLDTGCPALGSRAQPPSGTWGDKGFPRDGIQRVCASSCLHRMRRHIQVGPRELGCGSCITTFPEPTRSTSSVLVTEDISASQGKLSRQRAAANPPSGARGRRSSAPRPRCCRVRRLALLLGHGQARGAKSALQQGGPAAHG